MNSFSNIFKKKTCLKDALQESQKDMTVAMLVIEGEIASLQVKESKLVAEIRAAAEIRNKVATKTLARELVRLRKLITKLQGSREQMRDLAIHTQVLHANTLISTTMESAVQAMAAMNKKMAPAKVIPEFRKQSSQLEMKIEMMSEAIDETLDKEAEEKIEELTNQVLEEIVLNSSEDGTFELEEIVALQSKPIMSSSNNKMIVLKSSDGETFEVEETVALESDTIKHMIEDDSADTSIPLPNVTSKILSKVIEYCKKHVDSNDTEEDDLKAFDADFVKVDQGTLFDLILAAYHLKIKSLLDLTCQTVADMIKGKNPEEIRKIFNIKKPSSEEGEEVRKENAWAFE